MPSLRWQVQFFPINRALGLVRQEDTDEVKRTLGTHTALLQGLGERLEALAQRLADMDHRR